MLRIVNRDLHTARLACVLDFVIISTLLLNENSVDEWVRVTVVSVLRSVSMYKALRSGKVVVFALSVGPGFSTTVTVTLIALFIKYCSLMPQSKEGTGVGGQGHLSDMYELSVTVACTLHQY